MPHIINYDTSADVAVAAAAKAVETLNLAIAARGQATWVIAGGTSPMLAYRDLVDHCADEVDWSKVTVLIGDERCVPFDDPDCCWTQVFKVFEESPQLRQIHGIQPQTEETPEVAAAAYNAVLEGLPKGSDGLPTIDLMWVGVGEDGHTLSLFPDHPDFQLQPDVFVAPVHNSPKPPPNRITFTLKAVACVSELIVFATGAAKRQALADALNSHRLPIAIVSDTVESRGGQTTWLFDEDATAQ